MSRASNSVLAITEATKASRSSFDKAPGSDNEAAILGLPDKWSSYFKKALCGRMHDVSGTTKRLSLLTAGR